MNWSFPPEASPLWIRPGEKPIEYLYEVRPIPPRPRGLESVSAWDSTWPSGVPEEPERVLYLGALEWSWSPAHSRFDSYYLSYTNDYWLIYLHEYSDGMDSYWEWYPYTASPRVDGDVRDIGFWMVHDLLLADARVHEVDRYHIVSAQGLLTVGDFTEIGNLVWNDGEDDCEFEL